MKACIGKDDTQEIEQCFNKSSVIADDIQQAIADYEELGITGLLTVLKDIVKMFEDATPVMESCTADVDDFEKLSEMFLIDPYVLMERVSYNVMRHPWIIMSHGMAALTAWHYAQYGKCGEEFGYVAKQCVAEVGNDDWEELVEPHKN